MASLDSSGAAEAAEAAHARLARGGADLRASLEAVAQNIRSIVARRPEPFAPVQPTIDEVRPRHPASLALKTRVQRQQVCRRKCASAGTDALLKPL